MQILDKLNTYAMSLKNVQEKIQRVLFIQKI